MSCHSSESSTSSITVASDTDNSGPVQALPQHGHAYNSALQGTLSHCAKGIFSTECTCSEFYDQRLRHDVYLQQLLTELIDVCSDDELRSQRIQIVRQYCKEYSCPPETFALLMMFVCVGFAVCKGPRDWYSTLHS